LIPFFVFLVLVGIPLMYLELAVGQFISKGAVISWMMTPLFKGNTINFMERTLLEASLTLFWSGVGISMNLINNYVNIYYIMIIGYSLYYLVLSLNSELPWAKCNPEWRSPSKRPHTVL
jgi:SNF family Na+-dependent transporter